MLTPAVAFHVFERGWGLRALTDIPEGSFLFAYIGEMWPSALANEVNFSFLPLYALFPYLDTGGGTLTAPQPA